MFLPAYSNSIIMIIWMIRGWLLIYLFGYLFKVVKYDACHVLNFKIYFLIVLVQIMKKIRKAWVLFGQYEILWAFLSIVSWIINY